MNTKSRLRLLFGILCISSLVLGVQAQAKTFSMSGQWFGNRGPLIDIPINGGPQLCVGGSIKSGCVAFFKPRTGGVPGSQATISAMGVNPAAFTIAPGAFAQAQGLQFTPVGIVPTVVQLATDFHAVGPASAAQAAAAVPTFAIAQPAAFQSNAHNNDPGQTGGATPRAAANFAWCPGVGGPACPSGLAATGAANIQGIVSYSAGGNVFGGTMGMMLKGTGAVSAIITSVTVPTGGAGTTMIPGLAHLPIGTMTPTLASFMNPQAPGVSYAHFNTVMLGSAQVYLGFMTSPGGLLTSTGPPLTTGGPAMSPAVVPGDTITNWGMPWTTGTVTVMKTETNAGAMLTQTLSGMGTDERTGAGKGSIVMVAGGLSHRVFQGLETPALEIVVLNFSDGTPTPSMGSVGLAAVATLMALTAGYAVRGRFGRKQ